jgi:hypothetical protein
LSGALTDVAQTLSFGRGKLSLKYVAIGVPFATLGLFILYIFYFDDNFYVKDKWQTAISGWGVAVFGILLLARELYKLVHPGEPLLVLGPDGLTLNIDGFTFVRIPWHEVHGLATIDLTTKATVSVPFWLGRTGNADTEIVDVYKGVTAVLVSRDFFDKAIFPAKDGMERRQRDLATILKLRNGMVDHIRARRGLGPGWDSIFIMRDGEMHVALHHSILPVSRADLRAAVEARWHAFGGTPAASKVSEPR